MTTKQMIEIMQAYENGEQIEYRGIGSDDDWIDTRQPTWDWDNIEYRVRPEYVEPALLYCYVHPRKERDALVNDDLQYTAQTKHDLKVRDLLWYWEVKNDDGTWSMITDSDNNLLRTTWTKLSDENKYLFDATPIISMGFRIPKDLK